MLAEGFDEIDWSQLRVTLGISLAVGIFWDTDIVYPIKILVVFLHESSHGLATILTGGRVERIELDPREGGLTYSVGGNQFLISSAGYLGSECWGGLILFLASRTRFDALLAMILGTSTCLIGLVYVRPFASFGGIFTLAFGAVLFLSGLLLGERVNDVVLRVIGLTSCMYAILDIKSDILSRPYAQSDAAALAKLTGFPTLLWGTIWMLIALLFSLIFLLLSCRQQLTNAEVVPDWAPSWLRRAGGYDLLGRYLRAKEDRSVWEWEAGSGFQPYAGDCQAFLEQRYQAYRKGEQQRIQVETGSKRLSVDFGKMTQMDETSKRVRRIRRNCGASGGASA